MHHTCQFQPKKYGSRLLWAENMTPFTGWHEVESADKPGHYWRQCNGCGDTLERFEIPGIEVGHWPAAETTGSVD